MNHTHSFQVWPLLAGLLFAPLLGAEELAQPFGEKFPNLDGLATGEWWTKAPKNKKGNAPPSLDVPRSEVVAFALYTQHGGKLKLSAQLYPLKPGEAREVRLELKAGDAWREAAKAEVLYPGWSAHFSIKDWDATRDMAYRVRHGEAAMFEGLIRRDPEDKEVIVTANMSCNSNNTGGGRSEIVNNLRHLNPDVLFFAGDQSYRHSEHTATWLEFGMQFRDVMRDRPTICIPDDHDVGHANLWGEAGGVATHQGGADGGYLFPASYVNMVQRQQSWHLPDAVDPAPVGQGITVYFTRLLVGEVDFAILEDRKWKTGPMGTIPKMGPRPDHINDPKYDPNAIDLPELELLGKRQLDFLHRWGQDWTGAEMKAVLSQTAFCGAVHMHGGEKDRLLADLDCNGWPQKGRNAALREIRRAWAVHLCGDQHLAVALKHGIDDWGDGPYAFTSPALVNTVYGRWWHPLDEKPGPNPFPNSPLPWTGDFKDGLGNRISMMAYANPTKVADEKQRADGFGLVRFHKKERKITFECWPRFSDATKGDAGQFPGWPITVSAEGNDGRKPVGWLPELIFADGKNAVVQVVDEASGEILYTTRAIGGKFQPRVYAPGKYAVKVGAEKPDGQTLGGLEPKPQGEAGKREIKL